MPALRNVQILIVDDCVLNRNSLYAALAANGTPADGCAWDLITLASALRTVPGGLMLLNIATRNSTALLRTALATDPGHAWWCSASAMTTMTGSSNAPRPVPPGITLAPSPSRICSR